MSRWIVIFVSVVAVFVGLQIASVLINEKWFHRNSENQHERTQRRTVYIIGAILFVLGITVGIAIDCSTE